MNKTVLPGACSGTVRIPSSKSAVHRLLIIAAFGTQEVCLGINGLSRDILATAGCLSALGAGIQTEETHIRVQPLDRFTVRTDETVLHPGESGSTLRFLLPIVGALGRKAVFIREGRLSGRPLAPFDRLLTEHGMTLWEEGRLLHCEGQLQSGEFRLPGNVSSQFFTGLLLALPLLKEDSELLVEGILESASYVDLTEDVLRRSRVHFAHERDRFWHVFGSQTPELPFGLSAEGDWSNAAFFLCAGALSKAGVRVQGLDPASVQGDRAIVSLLKQYGAAVETDADSVLVRKGGAAPLMIEASEIPDLVPVLAVLCCGAAGVSEIRGASRLRLKESDRLQTTTALIRALGGNAVELEDGIRVIGTGRLSGGECDACNDHRIAMSAAVASLLCDRPVTVRGAECVEKSYPSFWRDFAAVSVPADSSSSGLKISGGEP